jgi:hypothetical protein
MTRGIFAWPYYSGDPVNDGTNLLKDSAEVGRCRLTVSNPVLKAPVVSALETKM